MPGNGDVHPADRIRNVALVGHRGSGKTSLHEALLFEAGCDQPPRARCPTHARCRTPNPTSRPGRCRSRLDAELASSGTTARSTCSTRPGEPSFVADALGALRVCESAVFVVNAVMGVEVTTARLWARAAELDIARMLFVNMLDRERADFFRTLEQLKRAFGQHVVATEIPIGAEHDLEGVIDLVDMKAFRQDSRASAAAASEIPIPDERRRAARRSTARS